MPRQVLSAMTPDRDKSVIAHISTDLETMWLKQKNVINDKQEVRDASTLVDTCKDQLCDCVFCRSLCVTVWVFWVMLDNFRLFSHFL